MTVSLLALVLGLGGLAIFAWSWHRQQYPSLDLVFFSVMLTVVGIGGLVMRGPPENSRYFAEPEDEDVDAETADDDADETDDDYTTQWERYEDS
jgi:hypothetical protein